MLDGFIEQMIDSSDVFRDAKEAAALFDALVYVEEAEVNAPLLLPHANPSLFWPHRHLLRRLFRFPKKADLHRHFGTLCYLGFLDSPLQALVLHEVLHILSLVREDAQNLLQNSPALQAQSEFSEVLQALMAPWFRLDIELRRVYSFRAEVRLLQHQQLEEAHLVSAQIKAIQAFARTDPPAVWDTFWSWVYQAAHHAEEADPLQALPNTGISEVQQLIPALVQVANAPCYHSAEQDTKALTTTDLFRQMTCCDAAMDLIYNRILNESVLSPAQVNRTERLHAYMFRIREQLAQSGLPLAFSLQHLVDHAEPAK
jgi:hypothetical protein